MMLLGKEMMALPADTPTGGKPKVTCGGGDPEDHKVELPTVPLIIIS